MTLNPNVQTLLQQGHDQLDRGSYQVAVDTFYQVAALEPHNPQVLYGLGLAYYRLEQYQDAVTYLNQALAMQPNYILALARRGMAYKKLKQAQEAQTDFEQAIALTPQDAEDWRGRGIALDELQRYEEAIASYDKAIEIKPDDHYAWYNRGYALGNLGRSEEVIASFDKAIEIKPDDDSAWYNRGVALRNLGRYEEAIASYDKAIEIKPDKYEAWNGRGVILCDFLKKYEEALTSFDEAIKIKPDDHSAWHNRGIALRNLERYEEAIASYDKAIKIKPDFNSAWGNRGYALNDLGRYEEAIVSYDKAIEIKPDDHYACNSRGIALRNLRRYEEAIASYDKAIKIKPDFNSAWGNRGNALDDLGRHEEAIASYNKGIEVKPDDHSTWFNGGTALNDLGRYEEAITYFDKSIKIRPDFYYAWGNRGNVLHRLGRHEEAIASYDKAIEIKPDQDSVWYNRGVALVNLGRYEEAIASFDEALRLTDYQSWLAWENRGLAVLKSQDYKAAVKTWDDGINALQPQTPDYEQGCGELHRRKGEVLYDYGKQQLNPFPDWFTAKASYEQALNFLTFNKFPQQHLQLLQELLKVCSALGDNRTFQRRQEEATQRLEELVGQCQSKGKEIGLRRKFAAFDQLRVDIRIKNKYQYIEALELAEARKNTCLAWLREGWDYQPRQFNYQDMQKLLNPKTAAVYWHISPGAITTFIIKYNQPPLVLQPQLPPELQKQKYPAHTYQLQRFEAWMQEWKQTYQDYCQGNYTGTKKEQAPWRQKMESMLLNQLRNILEINRIRDNLKDVEQLILIPHRELHLLPLDYLFPGRFQITYLPSFQIGLKLMTQVSSPKIKGASMVNIATNELPFTTIASAAFASVYPKANPLPSPIRQEQLITALRKNIGLFNFAGHANHTPENPRESFLMLTEPDKLTLGDIVDDDNLDLNQYELICLSACETGITSSESLTDEYVGLVSGFLAKSANYVVSSLWRVDERSTALLMTKFYQLFKENQIPATALKQAKEWLCQLTYADLAKWYDELASNLYDLQCKEYLKTEALMIKNDLKKMISNEPIYAHPYYWAGFILTGKPV
ncbi:tetratricopeptide repeat protein [Nostocaceae cyanobacterium CENA357]|uniref:Tetratricopeptide repeat protein n=1 Tax=Atlanticothrix silvestris CENA357 TaxID=1725252 RepID=A0A8J7L1K9_9CYAN|nr:tetratricopeptide repeat protein [Atlanticothrix silvestris]MBH8553520.1 tetratricopeptide repeat protein [Atlanticothrix silvestris CENA357]